MSRRPVKPVLSPQKKKLSEFDAVSAGLQSAQPIVCKNQLLHGCASNPAASHCLSARVSTQQDGLLRHLGRRAHQDRSVPSFGLHRPDREAQGRRRRPREGQQVGRSDGEVRRSRKRVRRKHGHGVGGLRERTGRGEVPVALFM